MISESFAGLSLLRSLGTPTMPTLLDSVPPGGWPVALCLLLELGVIIERGLHLRAASMRDQPFLDEVRERVLAGELRRAIERASATGEAALGRLAEVALSNQHQPRASIEAAMHVATLELRRGFTRHLSTLSGLGILALLVGVMTSVGDLLPKFINVADMSAYERGAWNLRNLSSSLGTAGFGLAVAVVAVSGRAVLGAWVRKLEDQLDRGAVKILNLIEQAKSGER